VSRHAKPNGLRRRDFIAGLGTLSLARSAEAPSWFEEIPPAKSGIRWLHDNGLSADRYLPETHGPGVAFIDYDGDGWMDIFLVNSGKCDFYQPVRRPRNALYHNNRNGTFTEVTGSAGIAGGESFGMGVAVGDFNNNGFPDMFVTAYGRSTLYRNNGNGTFTDVTEKAGVAVPGWTTSAAWFDYDGDGLLDLFVCGFVDYSRDTQRFCIDARGGKPGYCIPRIFGAKSSFLFKNNGDGTFRDVSRETGIAAKLGKALGVVATDVDNDGFLDLFVANDTVENFLFLNRGGRRFEDSAFGAMVALSPDGFARSGMGVDSADIDGDGWMDLFVANIDRERFSLYRNTRHGMFDDLSFAGEVGRATYYRSGWGLRFLDFDNDGVMDLIVANGHPDDLVAEREAHVRYREPLLLFRQERGRFRNVSAQAGPVFGRDYSARGLSTGDFNNDGRTDVLIGINGGSPLLLKNNAGRENSWLGLRLRGVKANRDAIGARISWQAGDVKGLRLKTGGGSYLSAHDQREVIGLGKAQHIDWVEIGWPRPSTRVERYSGLTIGRYVTLVEGEGEAVKAG
jgi:enediyne biosynthesis protein E4